MKIKTTFCVLFSLFVTTRVFSETPELINMDKFVTKAVRSDTAFKYILIEELTLQYKKSLAIPAQDLVLSLENNYNFFFYPRQEAQDAGISLSKLFAYSGSEISAAYSTDVSAASRAREGELAVSFSQSIARNAFGRDTRLLSEITDIQIDIARYQIVEAYEDYLARLMRLYYDWYEAYENLKTAENSYTENTKLLDNIKKRQKNKIALDVDVNKITLQVLAKKENLVTRQNQYDSYYNCVREALRYFDGVPLVPGEPALSDLEIDFDADYEDFDKTSRTSRVLTLLEEKKSRESLRYADALLPSIDLLASYSLEGSGRGLDKADKKGVLGISMEWPFPGDEEKARYNTSLIALDRQKLSSLTARAAVKTELMNLANAIGRERRLIIIAEEKIKLAADILKDEQENYSLGRSSLNDLIDEINKLEDNKFNKITHDIELERLILEWRRLTDSLVNEADVLRGER